MYIDFMSRYFIRERSKLKGILHMQYSGFGTLIAVYAPIYIHIVNVTDFNL